MQIITISRGSLDGAKKVAEHLAREIDVPIIKREDVFEEADKYSIIETGFCDISFIDRAPSVLERQYYRRKHYLLSFQVALLELVIQGSCIYEGHLGQYLLTGVPFVLRTRVIQPIEKRISSQREKNKMNYEQASNYVKLIDERRRHWSEFLYGVNIEDPKFYDLVINLDSMKIHTATNLITTVLQQPEFNSTNDSINALKNLYLSAKVKLNLYLSPITRGVEVDVDADARNRSIVVKGLSPTMDNDKFEMFIKSVVDKIPEVKSISFN
ncbi:MAG: cytidylate kinase-like family protein [Ignavibacteriae bacterium]|nr:cytidylate kinase-like family protein [Ignavibacteriota bacterium]